MKITSAKWTDATKTIVEIVDEEGVVSQVPKDETNRHYGKLLRESIKIDDPPPE